MRLLLGVLVLLTIPITARAEPGLDLAILLDRSTSMSRHATVVPAIVPMAARLLARNSETYGVAHRIAVINFASQPSIALPWSAPDDRSETLVARGRNRSRIGDGTDFLLAFESAERLFRSLPSDPTRRRAIVLVTDGIPYVRGAGAARYVSQLRRYMETQLARAAISIDVVLLARPSLSPRGSFWSDRVHHTISAAPADILATAHAVITNLVGTASIESTRSKIDNRIEHIVVPPYLEMIVFDIFRAPSETNVEVFAPGQREPIRAGINGVEAVQLGDVLETLAVVRPRAGEWVIRKRHAGSRVRVRSQQFFPRGMLVQPDGADAATVAGARRIVYQVLDQDQRPLAQIPGYPLSLDVTVALPSGDKVALPMESAPNLGPSVFRTTHDREWPDAGRYWTDIRVATLDATGRRLEVFRDRWSGFTVERAPAAVHARVLPSRPAVTAPARVHDWLLAATAFALIVTGAFLRLRKPKRAAPCLSKQPPQDER